MKLVADPKISSTPGNSGSLTRACTDAWRLLWLVGTLAAALLTARIFPQYRVIDHIDTYLWLHTAMEMLSVTLCGMIFGLYWAADNRHIGRGLTILSCGLLGVALFDFGHLLSYAGMPRFVTPSGADKAIAFWLAARTLAAFALLGAALSGIRPFTGPAIRHILVALVIGIVSSTFWIILVHPARLPLWFIPGEGVTYIKILFEYALCAIYMAAALGFSRKYRNEPGSGNGYLLAASVVAALSELWFTAYFSVSDQSNLLGHIYKIIAYLLIYEAMFTLGVKEPYARLDRSQRALAESDKRFRSLTALSSDWYWEQDAQYRFTEISGGINSLSEIAPEQMIGKTRWEIPEHGLNEEQWQAHRTILDARQTFHDLVIPRANPAKETRWISISGEPIFDDRGLFLGYRGIGRDITEQQRARENLQLAANVIEHSQEGVMITDDSNTIVAVNPAFTRITGYTAGEAIGRNPRLLSSGHHPESFYQDMWSTIANHDHWHGEVWDRRKNGELYCEWLSVGVVRHAGGNVRHHFAIFTDITQRKRNEMLLEAEKRHLEMVQTNQPLKRMLDQLCSDLEAIFPGTLCSVMLLDGVRLRSTAGPSLPADYRSAIDNLLIGPESGSCGTAAYMEQPIVVSDIAADPLWTRHRDLALANGLQACWSAPIFSGDGRVLGTFAIYFREPREPSAGEQQALDSAIRIAGIAIERQGSAERIVRLNAELERRVAERTAQLEAANRELESFSYSVSHDLRSPLRAINGFSQILLDDHASQLDAQGRRHLQSVRKASERMGELIDGMLELAQIMRQDVRADEVNLSETARSIAAQLHGSQPSRNVQFRIEEGLFARGDRRLLYNALENLLGNAWKFTSKLHSAIIRFGTTMHEGERVFYVSDNGAGFDMQYADKLFGAFQRLHRTTEFEGTGIGLATVHRIITRHGGRIWAESIPGEGATFYFTLPRQ